TVTRSPRKSTQMNKTSRKSISTAPSPKGTQRGLWDNTAPEAVRARFPRAMNLGYAWLILLVLTFAVVIAVATIRTKARHRRIRKALGLPARMETSSAEAQARQAVRGVQETDQGLSATAGRLSKEERRRRTRPHG